MGNPFFFYSSSWLKLMRPAWTMVENGNPPSKVSRKRSHFDAGRHPALKIRDANPILRVTTNRDESEKAPPAVVIVVGRPTLAVESSLGK